jgi:hypothetical protein
MLCHPREELRNLLRASAQKKKCKAQFASAKKIAWSNLSRTHNNNKFICLKKEENLSIKKTHNNDGPRSGPAVPRTIKKKFIILKLFNDKVKYFPKTNHTQTIYFF